jgi:hypothetical protein
MATEVKTIRTELKAENVHAGRPVSILKNFSRRRLTRSRNRGGKTRARITPVHMIVSFAAAFGTGSKVSMKRARTIQKTTMDPIKKPSRFEVAENVSVLAKDPHWALLIQAASAKVKAQNKRKKTATAIHSMDI